ncbi:hypothetical protein DNHGIG_15260 [Collibacillus ludicampi]|uniref:Uncharacterized protein n=1 Tax=Collibacillus ludicampi TaxID=2771369 RepID=A0AAV4LDV2_9BACL|nr:hypothetical protein DNHGIG_15260 [Collibacillus ludicampi]
MFEAWPLDSIVGLGSRNALSEDGVMLGNEFKLKNILNFKEGLVSQPSGERGFMN